MCSSVLSCLIPLTDPPLTKFRISPETISILNKQKGIYRLFPIQTATYDFIFDGLDLVGRARTGTGKTFSFALPVIERFFAAEKKAGPNAAKPTYGRPPRVICMCPTRELAIQVRTSTHALTRTHIRTRTYVHTQRQICHTHTRRHSAPTCAMCHVKWFDVGNGYLHAVADCHPVQRLHAAGAASRTYAHAHIMCHTIT